MLATLRNIGSSLGNAIGSTLTGAANGINSAAATNASISSIQEAGQESLAINMAQAQSNLLQTQGEAVKGATKSIKDAASPS